MPMAAQQHSGAVVTNFLWNLMPDSETTRIALARRARVSASNPFALIGVLGQDLPGAVQIVEPDRVEEITTREGTRRVSTAALASHLRDIAADPSFNKINDDAAHFSLAGAQPKKAILRIKGQWYEHKGRTPTTYILKPPMRDLPGAVENEHFCLRLAAQIGLRAARSEVVHLEDQIAICVERYDRLRIRVATRLSLDEASGKVFRIHQEDFCQATGVAPSQKYQADGGPGLTKIMSILEGGASPELDRQRFVQALILNYVLLGIDAHAKNFSLLIDHDGFRLAPLYDVISATPYDTKKYSKLAMSVGDEYRWRWIQARHWAKFCDEAKFPLEDFRQEMLRQAAEVPAAAAATLRDCARDGLDTQLLMKLVPALQSRCLDVETHAKMI